jgi:PKD repeat protein
VYFRSNKYPDFYYVEMVGTGDEFEAVLPIPSEETDEVIYYVEAVNRTFDMARTPEHDPVVASDSECRRRDAAAMWWTGSDPGIVVGATVDGAPAIPPGFQALGITGFVTAAGAMSSAGGGIGTGAAIGIGAGAAAAAGAGIAVASGGNASTTTTVVAGGGSSTTSTTAVTSTTTAASANAAPRACFTMDPADGNVLVGEPIKLDARCSQGDEGGGGDPISNYEWDLGDGRTRSGADQAFISPRWNTAGDYTVTLTVTDSGGSSTQKSLGFSQAENALQDSMSKEITIRPALAVEACFTSSSIFGCNYQFDGSCSNPSNLIERYDWVLDEGGVMQRVEVSGRVVTHDWGFSCFGNPVISIRLTVTGSDGPRTLTDTTVRSITASYFSSPFLKETQVSTGFTSYLGVAPFDGSARGQILWNGTRTDNVNSSSPFRHRARGRFGENTIEASIPAAMEQPGFWRFDFAGADGFVPGSIKVQSGVVTSVGSSSVVFRVSGEPGERIKFTFELLP